MASPQPEANVGTIHTSLRKLYLKLHFYVNELDIDDTTKEAFFIHYLKIKNWIKEDTQLQLFLETGHMQDAVDKILCRLKSDDHRAEDAACHNENLNTDAERFSSFDRQVHNTQMAWRREYMGHTHEVFDQVLLGCESAFDPEVHYARYMPIVQSSGAGKSRLIDFHSTVIAGICYTLRWDGHGGYPPGDPEITRFLAGSPSTLQVQPIWHDHAKFVALFAATVHEVSVIFESCTQRDQQRFPLYLHELFAPLVQAVDKTGLKPDDILKSVGLLLAKTRSLARIMFCEKVTGRAQAILTHLVSDSTWSSLFDGEVMNEPGVASHPIIVNTLLGPLRKLIHHLPKALSSSSKNSHRIPFFIAFDEVTNLVIKDDPRLLTTLRRIVKLLASEYIWVFVMSTQSPLLHITPAVNNDNSTRISVGELQRLDPFYAFPLDIGIKKQFEIDANAELRKPMIQFTTNSHMCGFGRPLWNSFSHEHPKEVRKMAKEKIIGRTEYQGTNTLQTYALLASRICLTTCMRTKEAITLDYELVRNHLRWILTWDANNGVFRTLSPSEPVVSEAAAHILNRGENWVSAVRTLNLAFLSPGLVDRGTTGELVARLLSILARDKLVRSIIKNQQTSPMLGDGSLSYSQTFQVDHFLQSLFTKGMDILLAPSRPLNSANTLQAALSAAWMNFSHWVVTEISLNREGIHDLLHRLLYQQAALQLCATQKNWDLLIPMYFGDITTQFNPDAVGAILFQIKNRKSSSQLFVRATEYNTIFGSSMPIVVFLLDLGVSESEVKRLQSPQPNILAYHIRGLGETTYNCITNPMKSQLEDILGTASISGHHAQRTLALRNLTFNFHTWQELFPECFEA